MEWDEAKDHAEKMGGRFIKLANKGDKVIGVIVGKPEMRKTYFNEKTNKTEKWSAEHEKAGLSPRETFLMNVLVVPQKAGEPGERALRIYESSAVSFKNVIKAREKYGPMKVLEIERQGAKGDTKNYNSCMPERDTTSEEVAIIRALEEKGEHAESKLKLHDLKNLDATGDDEQTDLASHDKKAAGAGATATPPAQTHAPTATAPTGNLSPEDVMRIGARVKALPDAQTKIKAFLAHFGVQQVKQIPAARLPEVMAFVDQLEGKAPAAPAEDDAFG